ncbi:MAG: 30S ribosomal protein S13 [Patescibacteria group bacterium]
MARISGIDIPEHKRVVIALTYIYGIGSATSSNLLKVAEIDENIRVKDLTEDQLAAIRNAIQEAQLPVEGELKRIISQNIRRLRDIKSYRGARHRDSLPVRGQRTRSNARMRKGKKKTVGGLKRKLTKK